ncbi:PfkB family carbohydrate kinase [Paraliomyxa miuraensis]|uniref:PfkB family carbohydrate kinase n=1 Tax=Paraliomyxa miuraensis TaxID=376150 RepID=UPI00225C2A52|nr:PfkB family carbohydrate kinase [Paraliomyxa miuraensis]MCX4240059.1 PfkB family carbohydrate kinase [Paraliomyxa miuraensis]
MIERTPSVVVVGSVAIDWVITPKAERERSVGGSATFFSMAASYFGPVRLCGVVGKDFPEQSLADLRAAHVDTEGLEVVPDGLTFHWKGRYHDDMNHRDTLDTRLNVFEHFDPRLPQSYRGSEYLFLANIQPALQLRVLDQMDPRPRLVGLDTMNLWIEHTKDDLLKVLARVDLLTINEEEARQLTGEPNLVRAARAIHDIGPRSLVIKRGEYGALLFHEGEVFSAPALPLEEVIDPTGAGDSFAGGFMGYLARVGETTGESLRSAMIYGSVMASYCVEGFSYDRLAGLDHRAIDERFMAFSRLTHFERARLL